MYRAAHPIDGQLLRCVYRTIAAMHNTLDKVDVLADAHPFILPEPREDRALYHAMAMMCRANPRHKHLVRPFVLPLNQRDALG